MDRSDAGGPWAGHAKSSSGYQRVLLALFFAGIATFAQLYSVQGVLPGLARDFTVSPADAALSVSTATLGLALAVIPWSWVADRAGRKLTMSWAISTAVVLGFLVSAAPTYEALLLIRFAEGAASEAFRPLPSCTCTRKSSNCTRPSQRGPMWREQPSAGLPAVLSLDRLLKQATGGWGYSA